MTDISSDIDPIDELVDEFLTRKMAGENPTISDFCRRYPDLEVEIRDVFPTLVMLEDSKPESLSLSEPVIEMVGDYRIHAEIGRGGMGIVYRASQESLGRSVALKVLSSRWSTDGDAMKRFRREAQAAARLHHTNIVPVYEVGEEQGHCYYAMQLIEGKSLDKLIADLSDSTSLRGSSRLKLLRTVIAAEKSTDGGMGSEVSGLNIGISHDDYFKSVAEIGAQAADALQFAHVRGIIHRDIKPSNLLLDKQGVVWITDFGLAKTDADAMTQEGDVLGTLCYMSPERFRGQCDVRADIYALGLTLYELLASEPAFHSTDRLQLINLISHSSPASPRSLAPEIPRDLEKVVLKAIEKDPEDRYQSAGEFSADLRRFLHDMPVAASQTSPLQRVGRWTKRNKMVASLLGAVASLLVFVTIISVFSAQSYRRQSQQIRFHSAEAEQQALLAEQRLSEVLRLADDHDLRTLRQQAEHLWPAVPDKIPAMEQWIQDAEELIARLPDHRKDLADVRKRGRASRAEANSPTTWSENRVGDLEPLKRERDELLNGTGKDRESDTSTQPTLIRRGPSQDYTHPAYSAHYFRCSFESESEHVGVKVLLRLWADDGAVVYLNGEELMRENLPEGEVSYGSLALEDESACDGSTMTGQEMQTSIRKGTNTLSVALHQFDVWNSDAYFDLELEVDGHFLVPRGGSWKYFDRGPPPSDWNAKIFDDSDWSTGSAAFGFGLTYPGGRLTELQAIISAIEAARDPEVTWEFDDPTLQWQHDALAGMIKGVERLTDPDPSQGLLASVKRRYEFAKVVSQRSITDCQEQWQEACRSIASVDECPQYGGLKIKPQLGLVPMGRDPNSGLWEFGHLQTGEPPRREDGSLLFNEDSCLVFVLLPGGTFRMGAEPPIFGADLKSENDAWRVESVGPGSIAAQLNVQVGDILVKVNNQPITAEGDAQAAVSLSSASDKITAEIVRGNQELQLSCKLPPNIDPFAKSIESPIQTVTLAPFFLSKYEMTQNQWQRVTGTNPSLWNSSINFSGTPYSGKHPVENINWNLFIDVIERRMGLLVPSEAQWEYGTRGGASTIWWMGNQGRLMQGKANLADSTARNHKGFFAMLYVSWLDDGYILHAPVDQYAANPFGLHGTIGNVSEWCRDPFSRHPDVPMQKKTGEKIQLIENRFRAVRGANYTSTSINGRAAARGAALVTKIAPTTGGRPARALDP